MRFFVMIAYLILGIVIIVLLFKCCLYTCIHCIIHIEDIQDTVKEKINIIRIQRRNKIAIHPIIIQEIQYATTTQRNITQQAALTTIPVAIQIS